MMLIPLSASSFFLFRALRSYPRESPPQRPQTLSLEATTAVGLCQLAVRTPTGSAMAHRPTSASGATVSYACGTSAAARRAGKAKRDPS
jgi:hypothetical protein